MKLVHKKAIVILLIIFLCFVTVIGDKRKAWANESSFLVLVQQENGSWKAYKNLIEVSDQGNLMIKAYGISKALGFTYKKKGNGVFVIKKSGKIYNLYTKNSKNVQYTNGTEKQLKIASDKTYTSKESNSNLCPVSSLDTLLFYQCFSSTGINEYSDYDGIVCLSQYNEIPETVPIVEIEPLKPPTPEPTSMKIEGVEFPVRDTFLSNSLSDWGGTALLWSELEQNMDGKIIESTDLWYDSNTIGFSHQGTNCEGVILTKANQGYKLSISVKLSGSVTTEQSASILKAMVVTISSKPSLVYEAIYDSFTSTNTHGINKNKYVVIGDCKVKVNIKDGIVTYDIKESK